MPEKVRTCWTSNSSSSGFPGWIMCLSFGWLQSPKHPSLRAPHWILLGQISVLQPFSSPCSIYFCVCVEVISLASAINPVLLYPLLKELCNICALWSLARLTLLCSSPPILLGFFPLFQTIFTYNSPTPKKLKWKERHLSLPFLAITSSSSAEPSHQGFTALDGFTGHHVTNLWAAPQDPLIWYSHKGGNVQLLHQKPHHQTQSLLQNTDMCDKNYSTLGIQATSKSWFFLNINTSFTIYSFWSWINSRGRSKFCTLNISQ